MYKSQVDRLCVCVLSKEDWETCPANAFQADPCSFMDEYVRVAQRDMQDECSRDGTPSLLSLRFKAHQTHQSKATMSAHRKHRDFIPNIANR